MENSPQENYVKNINFLMLSYQFILKQTWTNKTPKSETEAADTSKNKDTRFFRFIFNFSPNCLCKCLKARPILFWD